MTVCLDRTAYLRQSIEAQQVELANLESAEGEQRRRANNTHTFDRFRQNALTNQQQWEKLLASIDVKVKELMAGCPECHTTAGGFVILTQDGKAKMDRLVNEVLQAVLGEYRARVQHEQTLERLCEMERQFAPQNQV